MLRELKSWFLAKKAEVDRVFFPKIVKEEMVNGRSLTLRNGKELELRLGDVADIEVITAIQEACYGGKAPWGRLIVYNELQSRTSAFLLVMDEEQELAFIALSVRKGKVHITNIATDPRYQRQGIAFFLLEIAADIGRQLEQRILSLEVRVSNVGAIRLYEKFGFKKRFIKKKYYQDNDEDALEMYYQI